jgi:alpha-soluble NSF attachment protein
LCRLAAGDIVVAKRSIDSYGSDLFGWSESKESFFLGQIIQAIENYDVDEFTAAVQDWNSIQTLDAWRTSVLLKIKAEIPIADETNLL